MRPAVIHSGRWAGPPLTVSTASATTRKARLARIRPLHRAEAEAERAIDRAEKARAGAGSDGVGDHASAEISDAAEQREGEHRRPLHRPDRFGQRGGDGGVRKRIAATTSSHAISDSTSVTKPRIAPVIAAAPTPSSTKMSIAVSPIARLPALPAS